MVAIYSVTGELVYWSNTTAQRMAMKRPTLKGSSKSTESEMHEQIADAVTDAIKSNDKTIEIRPAKRSKGMGISRMVLVVGGAIGLGYWLQKSQRPAEMIREATSTVAERTKLATEQTAEKIEEGGEEVADRIEEESEKVGEKVEEAGEQTSEKTEEAGEKAAKKAEEAEKKSAKKPKKGGRSSLN